MSTPVDFSDFGKKCKDLLTKKFKKAKSSEFGVKSKSSDGNVEIQTSLVGTKNTKGKMTIKVKPLCSLEVVTATDEQMSVKLTAPSLYEGLTIKGSAFFVPEAVKKPDCPGTRAEIETSFKQGVVNAKVKTILNGQGWPNSETLKGTNNTKDIEAQVSVGIAKGIAVGASANLEEMSLKKYMVGAQYTGLPNMIGVLTTDLKKVNASFHYSGLAAATIGSTLVFDLATSTPTVNIGVEHQFNKNALFQATYNPSDNSGGIVLEHTLGNPAAKLQLTNTWGKKPAYAIYFNLE